ILRQVEETAERVLVDGQGAIDAQQFKIAQGDVELYVVARRQGGRFLRLNEPPGDEGSKERVRRFKRRGSAAADKEIPFIDGENNAGGILQHAVVTDIRRPGLEIGQPEHLRLQQSG